MKVLTEEEQVQQGAFLWGATPANSQVELGLSCGLWILMMVQWSRYANLHSSFFSLCQLKRAVACKSVISAVPVPPTHHTNSFSVTLLSPHRSHSNFGHLECPRSSFLYLPHLLISFLCTSSLSELLSSSPLSAYSASHTSLSVCFRALLALSLMIGSALNIM